MTTSTRLVVFDVDGTLVDHQALRVASMTDAFVAQGLAPPARAEILASVGLPLPVAIARLAPGGKVAQMVRTYRDSIGTRRAAAGDENVAPLFPGTRAMLDRLHATPGTLLGIATGKSRHGLDLVLKAHDLGALFATRQVADFHPSKPHPSMLLAAMDEAGVTAEHAVMVGDTTFDMEMAGAVGMPFIGVSWGRHPVDDLTHAATILNDFGGLDAALSDMWEREDE